MNKVLVVTGGSRGIGAATALLAAQRGYSVCVNYRQNREAAERVVKAIEATGARAVAVAGDVAVEADVVRLFETCDDALGSLAGLVNNAGILEPQMRVETMDAARLHRIFAANVIGSFMCAREAVRRMSTNRGRRRRDDRQHLFGCIAIRITWRVRRLRGLQGCDRYVDHRLGARGC
jgi:NAD(P)-dependent dehydrogenase (short-subunit alcohol dehydrogenase family)